MNRITVLITIIFTGISFISAQINHHEERKFKLGLLITPQLSWMNSDHSLISSDGSVAGISYGIVSDIFFAKNYAVSVALLRSHTGGKLFFKEGINAQMNFNNTFFPVDENSTIRYKLDYIEIPVGLKLKTKLFRRAGYYGQLGLTPMILTKAINGKGEKFVKEIQIGDMGYHFGGGLEYSLGGDTYLHLAVFYTSGLVDITTNDQIDDKTILNNVNLRLGINF